MVHRRKTEMTILDHYAVEKRRYIESCTQCGLCAKGCPILSHTVLSRISSRNIQKGIFAFMDGGDPNREAYTKAFACMECFKCTAGMCPEGLDPLLVNECIKGRYIAKGLVKSAFADPGDPDSTHRVLASVQVPGSEYNRITTAGGKQTARYVFFPGCNVYVQPEKILNALDIMDAIGDDYVFLPGLDDCCGDKHWFFGEIEKGCKTANELIASMARFQPEAVVLWCPTCHCRFETNIGPAVDLPFKVLSFPQYLAANMKKLPLTGTAAAPETVTLHEACKAAYTGADLNGPREVLRQLPGVTFREMEHHGRETVCCGSGAICWFPDTFSRIRDRRLREAADTGAERLVTVCHYCNQTFAAQETRFSFSVTNYVNLVAEAMGIRRDDTFRKYTLWGNLDEIVADAGEHIAESPFEREQIIEVLKAVFVR